VYFGRFHAMVRVQTHTWAEFHWRQNLRLALDVYCPGPLPIHANRRGNPATPPPAGNILDVSLTSKKTEWWQRHVHGGDVFRPPGGGCSLAFSRRTVCGVGGYLSFSCPTVSPSLDGQRQRLPAPLRTDSSVLLLLNSQSNPF
jgi:hypothetical protein